MIENPAYSFTKTVQPVRLFWNMEFKGRLHRFFSSLLRRSARLLELEQELCCAVVENSHYGGFRSVNIKRIRGTQGKADQFDDQFHPLKETILSRWQSVAREKLRGHDLPPVELLDVDGTYYVRDGHHRISVARSLGQSYIDAEIIVMNLNRRIS